MTMILPIYLKYYTKNANYIYYNITVMHIDWFSTKLTKFDFFPILAATKIFLASI